MMNGEVENERDELWTASQVPTCRQIAPPTGAVRLAHDGNGIS